MLTKQEKDQLENIAKHPVVLFSPLQKFILPDVLALLQKAHEENNPLLNKALSGIEEYINRQLTSANDSKAVNFFRSLIHLLDQAYLSQAKNNNNIAAFISLLGRCLSHAASDNPQMRELLYNFATQPGNQDVQRIHLARLFISTLDLRTVTLTGGIGLQLHILLTNRVVGMACLRLMLIKNFSDKADSGCLTPFENWFLTIAEKPKSPLISLLCKLALDTTLPVISRMGIINMLIIGLEFTAHRELIIKEFNAILADPTLGPLAQEDLFSAFHDVRLSLESTTGVDKEKDLSLEKALLTIIRQQLGIANTPTTKMYAKNDMLLNTKTSRSNLSHMVTLPRDQWPTSNTRQKPICESSITYETTFPDSVPVSDIAKASDTALILAGLKPKNPLIPPEPQSITITQPVSDSEEEDVFDSSSDHSPCVSDTSDKGSKSEYDLPFRLRRSFSS